jgi:hypothetical protein
MRIDDTSSNLFYWNGQDTDGVAGFSPNDVHFGALPDPNYRFYFLNLNYFVDGMDAAKPGGNIASGLNEIQEDGSMHIHRFYALDDGDGDSATIPAAGVYLFSMRLRLPGLKTSLPIYLVYATPGLVVTDAMNKTTYALDDAAAPWVNSHVDTLVLLGDYNKNGVVEAADYTVWRNTLGQGGFALPGDGDASGMVDMPDYFVWRDNYGKRSPTTGSAATSALVVPEPSLAILAALAVFALTCQASRIRNRARRGVDANHLGG